MPYSKAGRRAATAGRPKRKYKNKKTASVSRAVKKYVRRTMPAVEFKENWYVDTEKLLDSLTQGYSQPYPLIANGTSHVTRIGNEVNLKSFQVKGVLYNNSSAESYARLCIVGCDGNMDVSTASTFPLFRNTANGTTGGVGTATGLQAIYFPLNKLDLKIYVDKTYKLAGSVTASGGRNTRPYQHMIKFPGKGMRIKYEATSSGIGSQNRYILVFWVIADANFDTTTGTQVELSGITRFWYTDC